MQWVECVGGTCLDLGLRVGKVRCCRMSDEERRKDSLKALRCASLRRQHRDRGRGICCFFGRPHREKRSIKSNPCWLKKHLGWEPGEGKTTDKR